MPQWEYQSLKLAAYGVLGGKLDSQQLDQELNNLGAQGWEVVAAFDTNQAYGSTRDVVVLLKRMKNA